MIDMRGWLWCCVALLGGCGRVGFDGVGGTGDANGSNGSGGDGGTQDITVFATADTALNSFAPTLNYGGSTAFNVRGDMVSTFIGLVRFDLSSLSGTVANATMRITTSNAALSSGTVDVYEVLEAWDEGTQVGAAGTANYGMRQSLAAWTSAGCGVGSRGGAPVAELQPLATNTQYELALPAALVQGWIQDPTTNHGVALLTANSGTSTVTFFARESAMPPELVVEIGP